MLLEKIAYFAPQYNELPFVTIRALQAQSHPLLGIPASLDIAFFLLEENASFESTPSIRTSIRTGKIYQTMTDFAKKMIYSIN
ncbi:hypothetical protein DX933_09960 [Ornithinibacillus gellani]|uniref:hypothetical protein n=1 Tax=Ornithinibacillus gellani TaxID=2293253 RepID=UPI000F474BA7|nr:hypothetical protein [Ornithinibacillus gellani]TQS75067.1 hypothetical protein DX933_09960 [Ornithinibacillus gellani]